MVAESDNWYFYFLCVSFKIFSIIKINVGMDIQHSSLTVWDTHNLYFIASVLVMALLLLPASC